MKCICNKAEECKNKFCYHAKPHKPTAHCYDEVVCDTSQISCFCILAEPKIKKDFVYVSKSKDECIKRIKESGLEMVLEK